MKKPLKIIGILILTWGLIEVALIFYNMNYYMCKAGIEDQRDANKVCANLKK